MTALKCVLKNVNTEGRKNYGALLVRCPGCTVRRVSRSCHETTGERSPAVLNGQRRSGGAP